MSFLMGLKKTKDTGCQIQQGLKLPQNMRSQMMLGVFMTPND